MTDIATGVGVATGAKNEAATGAACADGALGCATNVADAAGVGVAPATASTTPAGSPLVSLAHARKSFGDVAVLKDISLSVCQGEVVAIIGPSGGGKSTLLRCLTMLETLDGGSLSYGDLEVVRDDGAGSVYAGKSVQKEAKARFGLVFQNFNLFPHYSVLKNITDAPIHVQKRSKEEVFAHARSLLAKMGLSDKENMVPCELSGGQQQRVAIARALCLNPAVLYFDEPTSALDPELTQDVLKVIRDLASEHMTMVIVTHEMGFARDVADRIVFMDGGMVVEQGAAADVISHPQQERTRAFLAKYKAD